MSQTDDQCLSPSVLERPPREPSRRMWRLPSGGARVKEEYDDAWSGVGYQPSPSSGGARVKDEFVSTLSAVAARSTGQSRSSSKQDTQRVFRIPHTTILGMLLAHLGLSPA
ncbi:hypothetical protein VPH35_119825 [Triticum aestivum]|uniref:Uncharacterized protein n=1 Tax=Triticum urartu TaxID=4572 RepID=A0A8R7QTD8_TRIUA